VDRGAAVHVGEWGVLNKTPHEVTLAWMEDCLSLWKEAGWGFALWNLRGPFGVLEANGRMSHTNRCADIASTEKCWTFSGRTDGF
jgi:hypothetical protein